MSGEPDWSAATWEGSRRAQIRRGLHLTVRERLEGLQALAETSQRLAQLGSQPPLETAAGSEEEPPPGATGPDCRRTSG